jgi:hypothetical protein
MQSLAGADPSLSDDLIIPSFSLHGQLSLDAVG